MIKIKPKNSKFLKDFYFNPTAALVFIVLYFLNNFDILVFFDNKNIHTLFGILFFILAIVFVFKTVINLFYNIELSEEIVTFNTPFNLHKKRVVFSTIKEIRFKTEKTKDDTIVFFLKTGEVISVGVTRYSKTQKEYLHNLISTKID